MNKTKDAIWKDFVAKVGQGRMYVAENGFRVPTNLNVIKKKLDGSDLRAADEFFKTFEWTKPIQKNVSLWNADPALGDGRKIITDDPTSPLLFGQYNCRHRGNFIIKSGTNKSGYPYAVWHAWATYRVRRYRGSLYLLYQIKKFVNMSI